VLLRERLKRADTDKARFHSELIAAEKRADRARSQSVAQMNGHESGAPKPEMEAEGDVALKPDPGAIPSAPPLLPSVSVSTATLGGLIQELIDPNLQEQVDGLLSEPMTDWRAIADLRGQKIAELDGRLKEANLEIKHLKVEVRDVHRSLIRTFSPIMSRRPRCPPTTKSR
jgi:hypothetical protein